MSKIVKYVGFDVHKNTIAVAVAEEGKRGEVREHGGITNAPALTKLLGKLGGPGVELRICYEAGPCGWGIQRQVAAAGQSCVVAAPSLIPSRPADRSKMDRRDAMKLARLHARVNARRRRSRCCKRAARPPDGSDREAPGRLDAGAGRLGSARAPGHGDGFSSHYRRRIGRHQPVLES